MNLGLNLMGAAGPSGPPTPPQPTPGTFTIVYHGQPVVKGPDPIIKTN